MLPRVSERRYECRFELAMLHGWAAVFPDAPDLQYKLAEAKVYDHWTKD